MRQKTRELALCSMLGALGVVFLFMGGVLPLAFYACPLLASATLLVAREECRRSYAWSCFFATAILGLLLGPEKEASLLYCVLGYYPLVQPRMDAIRPRLLRLFAKVALFLVTVGSMYTLLIFVFELDELVQEMSEGAVWLAAVTAAMGLVLFLLYDVLLRRFTILYRYRRKKKKH